MATLGNIIARVENELMYAPDLRAHRLDIRRVANARYGLLGRDKPWPWLQRRAPLWVFPDIVISNASVAIAGATLGTRAVAVLDSALATLTAAGDWSTHIRPKLAGAELGVTDPTLVTPGGAANWEDGPFVIEFAEQHATGPNRSRLWLDPRANLGTLSGTEGTFTLRWPRYQLPADLEVLERIVDDQGLEIEPLSPQRERGYGLDLTTQTGSRPCWALEDFGHAARFPTVVYPGVSDTSTPNPEQTEDVRQATNLPMRVAPAFEELTTGTLATGTRVRVFFCWWYAGRFGAPGPVTEYTVTGATNPSVRISGWFGKVVPVSATATSGAYGRRVAVFVSEDDSAFYLRKFVNPITESTYTLQWPLQSGAAAGGALVENGTLALPRYDRVYPGGPYTYLRLTPRPAAVARYELDYQARPADLLEDTDALEMPDQYSEVLVWATCLGMAERYARGADVSVWERNYREWRARLDQRYMPQLRYRMTKGAHGSVDSFAWIRRENVRYNG